VTPILRRLVVVLLALPLLLLGEISILLMLPVVGTAWIFTARGTIDDIIIPLEWAVSLLTWINP
jgi:hypothetical protein